MSTLGSSQRFCASRTPYNSHLTLNGHQEAHNLKTDNYRSVQLLKRHLRVKNAISMGQISQAQNATLEIAFLSACLFKDVGLVRLINSPMKGKKHALIDNSE